MPENQLHGFLWEKSIVNHCYKISSRISYTEIFDIPHHFNPIDGKNISIKSTGRHNMVCMGDCLRVFDNYKENAHMIVLLFDHDDVNKLKVLRRILEIDLSNSHDTLFGSVTREEIQRLYRMVKSVPVRTRPTEEENRRMSAFRDKLNAKSGAIQFNIKCDSRQSRLQCSFNRFMEFVDSNPQIVIADQPPEIPFRNALIPKSIPSTRRERKPQKDKFKLVKGQTSIKDFFQGARYT